jgi:hypothetical protein
MTGFSLVRLWFGFGSALVRLWFGFRLALVWLYFGFGSLFGSARDDFALPVSLGDVTERARRLQERRSF